MSERRVSLYDCMKPSYIGSDRSGGMLSNPCEIELPAGPDPGHHSPRCIWHYTKSKPTPEQCGCKACASEYGVREATP